MSVGFIENGMRVFSIENRYGDKSGGIWRCRRKDGGRRW